MFTNTIAECLKISVAEVLKKLDYDIMLPKVLTIILFFLCVSVGAQARVVNSKTDLERLRGFFDHEKLGKKFDQKRLSDIDQARKERVLWDKQQQKSLAEYKKNSSDRIRRLGDESKEYQSDLNFRIKQMQKHDKLRRQFVDDRNQHRNLEQAHINLSELKELDLIETRPRVEFKNRTLIAGAGTLGAGSGRFSGSAQGSAGIAPPPEFSSPPPPPPPDFFDAEPPPPPPPPMDSVFPGGFDDTIPPPIFDDGPDF